MSSKLVVDERAAAAHLLEWPLVGGGTLYAKVATEFSPAYSTSAQSVSAPDLAHVVAAQQHRIHELEQELVRRTRESFEQGHSTGFNEAQQKSSEQLTPMMERLARTIEDLASQRRRVRAEAEEDAVRLALAVARKILHREVTVDSDSLLGLMKAAMRRIDAQELHRVRVHPDDIPILERYLGSSGFPSKVEVIADLSLERGGVILETTRGSLDASISTQLAEIERGFIDIIRHTSEGK